ncbi:MAG: hypothetical protein WA005_04575, partial [Candidatus Binataceae bacterium]
PQPRRVLAPHRAAPSFAGFTRMLTRRAAGAPARMALVLLIYCQGILAGARNGSRLDLEYRKI